MATWEDGPEYAPLTRPSVFDAPQQAVPLSYASPAQRPAPDAPLARPEFTETTPGRPLDEYVPTRDTGRDPNTAFKTTTATMTSVDSAWGAVHQHQAPVQSDWPAPTGPPNQPVSSAQLLPTEPITLSRVREGQAPGFPPPTGHPVDFPPPTGAPVNAAGVPFNAPPPQGPPVSGTPGTQPLSQPAQHVWSAPEQWPTPQGFGELFLAIQRSLSPAVLWSLVGGCILLPFSPLLFTVAATASGYAQHRRRWIRNIFIIGGAVIATVFVIGLFAGGITQLGSWWNLVSWTSLFVCIVTLASTVWLTSNAVSRGEPPETPDEY